MWSGRHIFFLGVLACAGLVSVRDSQEQVGLGYEMARVEEQLRKCRQELETERARLQALQAPPRVIRCAQGLHLNLAPASPLSPYTPAPAANNRPGAAGR
jgi:hypothetical protein